MCAYIHWQRPFCAFLVSTLALAGCASVPSVDKALDESNAAQPTIVASRGPLTPAQTRIVLTKLQEQEQGSDVLEQHLAIEQAVAEAPLVVGNHTRLLEDGPATFRAMFKAIRSAKQHIYLEYYIFENIESDGEHLADLLLEKRREGVAIDVIYDSYGSIDTPREFLDQLRAAGVVLLEFHPLNPLKAGIDYAPNERDHRKILDVDGKIAIIGGVNLYTAYQPHPHARLVASDGEDPKTWHDTDLEIEGPAVSQLEQVFLDHWSAQQGPPLADTTVTRQPTAGLELLRVIGSEHGDTIPRYYATLLSAIRSAQQTIWITTAYFVPTDDEARDLEDAARRGVDVRLMLPGRSDSSLALAMGRARYGELLEAGVKIFEMKDGMLHSKTAVIDGVWSTIGSSNFDHRSILFNDEVDVVVLGRETAQQLEALFQKNQAERARPVSLADWEDRPLSERLRELYARALVNLL